MNRKPAESKFDPLQGHVSMHWDGKDVEDHSLDVRVFGAALIDMANVIERAVQVLHTEEYSLAVKVKSDFKSGSFNADLAIALVMGHQAVMFLNNNPSLGSLHDILGLVFNGAKAVSGGAVSLVNAIRAIRSDPIDKLVKSEGSRNTAIIFRKTEQLEVDSDVLKLLTDPAFRECFGALVNDSMARPGISHLQLSAGPNTEPVVITPRDVGVISSRSPELPAPTADNESHTYAADMWLHVNAAVFTGGTQWKFTSGQQSFAAKIKDDGFNDKIARGEELFGAGDSIFANVRVTQESSVGKKPKASYEIVKVHRHVHPQKTPNLL